jgi:sulfate transport system substrate-binding protein
LPYHSTIVFVVRKGNPKNIHDWPDLVQPGVEIITPNPLTGGGAKLNFLAAWGSVVLRGGNEDQAKQFLGKLYAQVPVLDSGARGSAVTFAQKKIGDVHLAWENEAFREVQELPDELELVYPPISIRAEPNVAVVDTVAEKRGTSQAAADYLQFLYSDEAQEVAARHYYRPSNPEIAQAHAGQFKDLKLFPITDIARDWDEAFQKFFASGGVYEAIYQRPAGGSPEAKPN